MIGSKLNTKLRNYNRILFYIGFLFFIPSLTAQVIFEINDFNAYMESISLRGNASLIGKKVRIAPAQPNSAGAVWYQADKIDLSKGFFTEFAFVISDKDKSLQGGDGFAFVIQNQSVNELGGIGDNIGYKQIQTVVAIEFDIFNNDEESKNHVCLSFYDPSKETYRKYATVHEIPEISDGKPHFARIEYLDNRLQFYLDSYIFPILSVGLDVADKIQSPDDMAWLGFTGSTSAAYANHDLLSWSLGKYLEKPEDIDENKIKVSKGKELIVRGRKLKITLWDDRQFDRDTVSLKIGDEWVLTNYEVRPDKKVFQYTLKGFSSDLILYAHNIGLIPPNTAAMIVDDGYNKYKLRLKADLNTSESIRFRYQAPE